jgi:hypothetical protein
MYVLLHDRVTRVIKWQTFNSNDTLTLLPDDLCTYIYSSVQSFISIENPKPMVKRGRERGVRREKEEEINLIKRAWEG